MKYYEVIITVQKPVCVLAEDEAEAEEIAEDQWLGDWFHIEAATDGTLDETKDAEIIKEYKAEGNYFEA